VQQSSTGFQPVTAALTCVRGQAVAWEARDIAVSGSGSIMFTVTVAAVKSTNTAAPGSILIWTNSTTVTYTKSSSGSGSIKYTCDNNGNRTYKWTNGVFEARYFYDVDNQLVGISFNNDKDHSDAGDYTYEYDPFGRRTKAIEDTTNRYFVYDGLDCIAELDSTGGVTKTYLRGAGLGGGIGDIVAAWSMVDGQWLYFSYNHRGDVVTLTRPDGTVTNRCEYDAFGIPVIPPLAGSPVTRFIGFSSKEYDTKSGLSYYGFRFYDAQSGRWINKDPALWLGGMNLYRHTRNNPIAYMDTRGYWPDKVHEELSKILGADTYIDFTRPDHKYVIGGYPATGWLGLHLPDNLEMANKITDKAICDCNKDEFETGVHFGQDYYGHKMLLGVSLGNYAGDVAVDVVTLPIQLAAQLLLRPLSWLGASPSPPPMRSTFLDDMNEHDIGEDGIQGNKPPSSDEQLAIYRKYASEWKASDAFTKSVEYTRKAFGRWTNSCIRTGSTWSRR